LSTSGHIAAMVNPPGNDKARYQVAKEVPEDPQEWLRPGGDRPRVLVAGLRGLAGARCGEERARAEELGGGGLAPISAAPGTYVYDR